MIQLIKIKDLLVEEGYNVRSDAETNRNAKDIAAAWSANGGQDPSEPIPFVMKDGKKYTRGHARREAAIINGYKEVYAVEAQRDWLSDQVHLVTGNEAHPLSPYQQGAVYVRMRDGKEAKKVGEESYAPMKVGDIAAAVGKTTVHIANCILIHESPEEIGEMILAGKIGANAIVLAYSGERGGDRLSDVTAIKIIKAAYKLAAEQGKEMATDKHVREVKPQFVVKKLKASSSPAASSKSTTPPAQSIASIAGDESSEQRASESESESSSNSAPAAQSPDLPMQEKLSAKKVLEAKYSAVIEEWATARKIVLEFPDVDALVVALCAVNLPF